MCTPLCNTVVHNTARSNSDNIPTLPPENHYSSDAVYRTRRGLKVDQQTVYSTRTDPYHFGSCWRRGVVVSGLRRMNEVNARRARLVPGWVTVFGWVYHLGM